MKLKYYIKIFIIIIILSLLSLSQRAFTQKNDNQNRKSVIHNLTHLDLKNFPDSLWQETFDRAFHYIQKGDRKIFSLVLELSKKSDAALSELLGAYWGDLLINNTKLFLELALEKSMADQKQLATLALYMDGGGMRNEEYEQVEKNLNKFLLSRNPKIANISKSYLSLMHDIRNDLKK
jgi:hypothetical protein